jgi:hypothetical protein
MPSKADIYQQAILVNNILQFANWNRYSHAWPGVAHIDYVKIKK